jgi:hypothetical protein
MTFCRVPVSGPEILEAVIPDVAFGELELKRTDEIIVVRGRAGPRFALPMPMRTIGGRPTAGVATPESNKEARINFSVGLKIVCMIPLRCCGAEFALPRAFLFFEILACLQKALPHHAGISTSTKRAFSPQRSIPTSTTLYSRGLAAVMS